MFRNFAPRTLLVNGAGDDVRHAADDRHGNECAGGQVPNRGFRVFVHRECLPLATSKDLTEGSQEGSLATAGNVSPGAAFVCDEELLLVLRRGRSGRHLAPLHSLAC